MANSMLPQPLTHTVRQRAGARATDRARVAHTRQRQVRNRRARTRGTPLACEMGALIVGALAPVLGWPGSKQPPPPPPPLFLGGYGTLLFSIGLCAALPFLCFAFFGPPKKDGAAKDKV